ncbi:MAG: M23 family metallopeptidase [Bacteroidota bacterium]
MVLIIPVVLMLFGCKSEQQIPKTKYSAYPLEKPNTTSKDGKWVISFNNNLHCPVTFRSNLDHQALAAHFPVTVNPLTTHEISIDTLSLSRKDLKQFTYGYTIGNPNATVESKPVSLPFLPGRSFKILQGHNGSFSHQSEYSKYAVDFDLQVGDTICAAADGVVVGLIDKYERGGNDRRLRDYANFITIFHPTANYFSQYVHLRLDGALINVGDTVVQNQPIGISGNTGFSGGPHLHFNILVIKSTGDNLKSFPVDFIDGYKGGALKKGDIVRKQ